MAAMTVGGARATNHTLGGPGGMQHLVMALGNVHWYANAGNGWARFHPLLPHWLFPPAEALRDFYQGQAARVP